MNTVIIADSSFVQKLRMYSLIALGVGALGLAGAAFFDMGRFLQAYLLGYIYFAGITIVSMFFSSLQFLVNAGWSAMVRRIPEIFAGFLPVVLIGLIPMIVDVWFSHKLYHWADPSLYVPGPHFDEVLATKHSFLNPTFFTIRLGIYALIWFVTYRLIIGNSFKQDESTTDYTPTRVNMKRSAPMVLLFAMSLTFAGFDLVMSLDPHWFSTMFGVYFFAGNFVSTLSLIAIFIVNLRRQGHLKGITDEHYHDIGKFMFAFTVFWTYITFSQYFLIWYGNLPEETLFFILRAHGNWQFLGYALVFGHFIVPFVTLLTQNNKRNPAVLIGVGCWILFMHFIDLSFIILPNFSPTLRIGWQEITGWLFFAGLFFFMVTRQLATRSIVAVNDPYLKESLELVS
ncbi:MAG: quinol:cytochrome C oxidoreductase [Ignavibacteria bacterium]|nr:quinol:cytochrome C oxidoreductase [Ignavibacteria bacterium]